MRYWIILCIVWMLSIPAMAQDGEATAEPESTEEPQPTPTAILMEPLLNLPIAPPVHLDLPGDWLYGYDTLVYTDVDGRVESVPFALYTGPISTGTGTIVLIWGFDSVVNPFTGQGTPNLWLDGLRLLRLIIFDANCNIGTAPEREYSVGEYPATGTQFSAVDCPEGQPDTRGWFAAVRVDGLNFAFYMYMDPLQPPGTNGEYDLQAILDTVEINVEEVLITQEEFQATQQALLTDVPLVSSTPEATEEMLPEATEESED